MLFVRVCALHGIRTEYNRPSESGSSVVLSSTFDRVEHLVVSAATRADNVNTFIIVIVVSAMRIISKDASDDEIF